MSGEHGFEPPALRPLLTDLVVGESARWHDGRLWFAHWGTGEIVAVDLDGVSEVVAQVPNAIPFSIDWLPDGPLVVICGSDARLLRLESDGQFVEHADVSQLSRGFNEIVIDGRGNIFLDGGGFDLMAGEPFAPGIVALVRPDGSAQVVADGIAFGNGLAVTPDDQTLIVAESYGNCLTAFDIDANGELSNRRVWAALDNGVPDGICMDAEGAIWYADVPNQSCVRVREGGEVLAALPLGRGGFSCTLGGSDGRTLFALAAEWNGPANMFSGARTGQVLMTTVSVPHAGHP
jgi:sugar lactone lactonase YvrE